VKANTLIRQNRFFIFGKNNFFTMYGILSKLPKN